MNWDDLRIIATVRDAGTYARASARLRIDETTVARRVARVQSSLGVTLFNAVDGMRKPTTQCEEILAHVQEIARRVADIGEVGKAADGLVGRFRIASTNAIGEDILAPRAASFLAAHPGLTLQFMTSGENISFWRWEADLAIRLRKPERGDFTITRLADFKLFFFEPRHPEPTEAPIVCCYPDDLDHTSESRYLIARRLQGKGRCVTENTRVIKALIKAHAAVGVLPEHSCADLLEDPELRATPVPHGVQVWLLVQTHLKRDPAARAVIDWVRETVGGAFAG